jgi:hypothetical protein
VAIIAKIASLVDSVTQFLEAKFEYSGQTKQQSEAPEDEEPWEKNQPD